MRALLRFAGQEGRISRGQRFRTTERRAQAFESRVPPLAARVHGKGSGERWPLHITPEVYLKLYPEGEHAAVARRLLP